MDKKLYDLMDWAGIEEIVYSEAADPHKLLGPHVTDDGLLISAFIQTAVMVTVRLASSGKEFPMELADEAGFFSACIFTVIYGVGFEKVRSGRTLYDL